MSQASMQRSSQSDVPTCYWPAPLIHIPHLGYAAWVEAAELGTVIGHGFVLGTNGGAVSSGATLVRCQWFTVLH